MDRERIKGAGNPAKGAVKGAAGILTGDREAQGKLQKDARALQGVTAKAEDNAHKAVTHGARR